jgi:LCP family protein required for cell wall assembly
MDLQDAGRHARTLPRPDPADLPAGRVPVEQPRRVRVRRARRRGPWRRFKRFVRRHKALSVIVVTALVLLAIIIGWLLWLNTKLGDIDRFPFEPGGDRPAKVGAAQNILLIGVDDPAGHGGLFEDLASGDWEPGRFRSDAIMVLHVSGDRRSAQLVSIPRDSFVDVPDLGRTKINASFSDGGPEELAQVVESLSDLHIDHAVVIDFQHLAAMTTAMGGVDVVVPETVADPQSGITWEKGPVHLEGDRAVRYVRQRYALPRGDFDRIQRQQNVLRAMLDQVASAGTLANPFRVTRLVTELASFVAVDDGFTPAELRSLAISSRGIRPTTMRFVTVPVTGTPTIDGASVVTLDLQKTADLFDALEHDRFEDWYRDNADGMDELPPAEQVR